MINLDMAEEFKKKSLDKRGFFKDLLLSVFLMSLSYTVIFFINQQSLRQGANDPQMQISQDAALQLASGKSLEIFLDTKLVDIEASLSPYIFVYDDKGVLLFSSARLSGNVPSIPKGVLSYTRANKIDKVTWQPRSGVRQAIVARYYEGSQKGFVVSGRSLLEVEARIDHTLKQMLMLWFVSVVFLVAINYLLNFKTNRKQV